jgi:hypothetical protein
MSRRDVRWRLAALGGALMCGSIACGAIGGQPVRVPAEVRRIEVTVDTGTVTVVGAPAGSRAQIGRATRAFPYTRGFHEELTGSTLQIEVRCGGAPGCRVDHELRLPPEVEVAVYLRDGDVELSDYAGDATIDVGLGKVTGAGLRGASVDVATEGGGIDLVFVAPPRRLVANAAAGDVSLRVPAGSYRCDLDPAAGEISVACDPAAPHTIAASTGVGRLRVRATPR